MIYGFGGLRAGRSPLRSPEPPNCLQTSYLQPQNNVSYPFSFQSLAHSFGNEISATRVLSKPSALFTQNTGGRYSPPRSAFCFQAFSHSCAWDICSSRLCASVSLWPSSCAVVAPSSSRWSPVVFPRKTHPISFLFISLPDSFLPTEG